nr:immunoglobulin heavy chain junction region [Mus musculus]MBK4197350.1 immunoglobulin heavy chain junction region [Mus musculus]MBK4197351.1 immunoglobulin heavy chain junction region [Mus musculus]
CARLRTGAYFEYW